MELVEAEQEFGETLSETMRRLDVRMLLSRLLPTPAVEREEGTPPDWYDPDNASMWATMAAGESGPESDS